VPEPRSLGYEAKNLVTSGVGVFFENKIPVNIDSHRACIQYVIRTCRRFPFTYLLEWHGAKILKISIVFSLCLGITLSLFTITTDKVPKGRC